ncbi:DNA translocase FtsK 2 [Candidatus Desulfarcum epimagneticum]|uniref:DNA translocase FtsK 2 n=1 Tax=uncultured Desulfobacteraceae bacterium TaxID=218296 RepID=A0A484HH75_9BACT|nr:DNA translocase FtsK 2 [uncultured Desulfobacteraceae bacterium]
MRKELFGILFFFLVVFALISLLSYSPADPSFHNAKAPGGDVHNLFGLMGARAAGFLIGFFGAGAFWTPVILFFLGIGFFKKKPGPAALSVLIGGMILALATGGLLSLTGDMATIGEKTFTSGGIAGISIRAFLVKYVNPTGAAIVLSAFFIVGFILATHFSVVRFARACLKGIENSLKAAKVFFIIRRERKKRFRAKKALKKKAPGKAGKKQIAIKAPRPAPPHVPAPKQTFFEFMSDPDSFSLPSPELLDDPGPDSSSANEDFLRAQSQLLEKKLSDFGVKGEVSAVSPGPVITTFEYQPAPGVKINRIVSLADDLSMALRAESIRIVAPIPGKAAIGIELPNAERQVVRLKRIVLSDAFARLKSGLAICLGMDIVGGPVAASLEKMPHLLIAGATGAGKSVGLNAMICSFLFKASPDQVKMIMIDPKRIELSVYDGIPHLITPVVTDSKKATHALFWAVREMERRYKVLAEKKARNIAQYNARVEKEKAADPESESEKLPLIVIIIDELADMMMVTAREVEAALTRLAQMARAAGIHLILATQRPSVDVLTGVIKANFPTRLTFQVSSRTDSRTIIDSNGAEALLGNGDMLFLPPGAAKLQRIHGAYVSYEEIERVTSFLKQQGRPDYDHRVCEAPEKGEGETGEDPDEKDRDEKYDEAVALVTQNGQASISMIQRHMRVGYNRAARIIETMEKEGVIGPPDGVKPRKILVKGYDEIP